MIITIDNNALEVNAVVTRDGYDYKMEIVPVAKYIKFEPPLTGELRGVNPDDAYTNNGYTDATIRKGVKEFADCLIGKHRGKKLVLKNIILDWEKTK